MSPLRSGNGETGRQLITAMAVICSLLTWRSWGKGEWSVQCFIRCWRWPHDTDYLKSIAKGFKPKWWFIAGSKSPRTKWRLPTTHHGLPFGWQNECETCASSTFATVPGLLCLVVPLSILNTQRWQEGWIQLEDGELMDFHWEVTDGQMFWKGREDDGWFVPSSPHVVPVIDLFRYAFI